MKKSTIFLTLLLFTCKTYAADHSYLIGEHSSRIVAEVGQPKEKMSNSLTGKSVWTYENFRVLIRDNYVIKVSETGMKQILRKKIVQTEKVPSAPVVQVAAGNNQEKAEVAPGVLEEVMQELKAKSAAVEDKTKGSNPTGLPGMMPNKRIGLDP